MATLGLKPFGETLQATPHQTPSLDLVADLLMGDDAITEVLVQLHVAVTLCR